MAMLTALPATLARPRWWLLALAGFLVRGGVVLALLPIVALPSVAGLADALGPILVSLVFGQPSVGAVALVLGLVLVGGAWLAGSANLGGWLDLVLAEEAVRDEAPASATGLAGGPGSGSGGRAGAVRLLAHLPTAITLALAAPRIVDATYSELIQPGAPTDPILVRVVGRVPLPVAIVIVAWVVGEAVGGIGVRELLRGAGVGRAVRRGFAALRHPGVLATLALTDGVVAAVIALFWLAAGVAWEDARVALIDGGPGLLAGLTVALFLATWLVGLCVLSVVLAWRAAAWTAEVLRRD